MSSALKKTLGIFCLLVVVFAFTAIRSPNFLTSYNIQNTIRWTSLFGIIAIGVALVIITGGIDLSIGSVVGLIGCLVPWLLAHRNWSMGPALLAALSMLAQYFENVVPESDSDLGLRAAAKMATPKAAGRPDEAPAHPSTNLRASGDD